MVIKRSVLAVTLLAVAAAGCSKVESQRGGAGTASTQPGSAAEQSGGPKQGASDAACRDLPSADQLKQWLREAPGQGEAGGLMSGRMEWAAVVDRRG